MNASAVQAPPRKQRTRDCQYVHQGVVKRWDGHKWLCPHDHRAWMCKHCKGGGCCEHGARRYDCARCRGKGVCEHGSRKGRCTRCHPPPHSPSLSTAEMSFKKAMDAQQNKLNDEIVALARQLQEKRALWQVLNDAEDDKEPRAWSVTFRRDGGGGRDVFDTAVVTGRVCDIEKVWAKVAQGGAVHSITLL